MSAECRWGEEEYVNLFRFKILSRKTEKGVGIQ